MRAVVLLALQLCLPDVHAFSHSRIAHGRANVSPFAAQEPLYSMAPRVGSLQMMAKKVTNIIKLALDLSLIHI